MEIETATIKLYNKPQHRLTALWAISESGLGGMMHAFKIPFTGFFLGGFAIVIIILMAYYSDKPFKTITQATLMVVIIKATASPHSPPMAYLAVFFQGICGAFCLAYIPWKKAGVILFGLLALLESAVQKFLITTLIFGKSVWEALDVFFLSIVKDFSLNPAFSFSFWLIAIYTGIYCLWGITLSWWTIHLTTTLKTKAQNLFAQPTFWEMKNEYLEVPKKGKRARKIAFTFFTLLFICGVFVFNGFGNKAVYVLLRTLAALLLMYTIITPVSQWLFKKWTLQKALEEQQQIDGLLQIIPEIKQHVFQSMQLAKQQKKGLAVYKEFVVNLIILSLFEPVK